MIWCLDDILQERLCFQRVGIYLQGVHNNLQNAIDLIKQWAVALTCVLLQTEARRTMRGFFERSSQLGLGLDSFTNRVLNNNLRFMMSIKFELVT